MDRTALEQTHRALGTHRRQLDANRQLVDHVDEVCASACETLARARQAETRAGGILAVMYAQLRRHTAGAP
jgi:hypothetical protein